VVISREGESEEPANNVMHTPPEDLAEHWAVKFLANILILLSIWRK